MKRLSILGITSLIVIAIMLGCYFPMFARVAAVILAMIVFMIIACFVLMFSCKDDED